MQITRMERGFTLVELLVVVVIIGILAAIALPDFIGAQQKAKAVAVKGNIRTTQIAAEAYATDSLGSYGLAIDLASYYVRGSGVTGGRRETTPRHGGNQRASHSSWTDNVCCFDIAQN